MPRQARLDAPGLLHHVINRGNDRQKLFIDRSDYAVFRDALAELIKEGGFTCYAWVLLPTHFHVLLETGSRPLSELMNRLSTRYAGYFNRQHNRSGRLFKNRYKSTVCDRSVFFKDLVAYVHLIPLKENTVGSLDALDSYPWSGHRALLGLEKASWQAVDAVWEAFGGRGPTGIKNYAAHVAERKKSQPDLSGGGLVRSSRGMDVVVGRNAAGSFDSRVLGGRAFVESVLPSASAVRIKAPDPVLADRFIRGIETYFGLPEKTLSRRGKSTRIGAEARSMASYLLSERCGMRKIDVADLLGITQPAVTHLYRRGLAKNREADEISKSLGIP